MSETNLTPEQVKQAEAEAAEQYIGHMSGLCRGAAATLVLNNESNSLLQDSDLELKVVAWLKNAVVAYEAAGISKIDVAMVLEVFAVGQDSVVEDLAHNIYAQALQSIQDDVVAELRKESADAIAELSEEVTG